MSDTEMKQYKQKTVSAIILRYSAWDLNRYIQKPDNNNNLCNIIVNLGI